MALLRGGLLVLVLVGAVTGCATAPVDTASGGTLPVEPTHIVPTQVVPPVEPTPVVPTPADGACVTRYEVAEVFVPVPPTTVSAEIRVHDGPPNHVENNRWKQRAALSPDDHAAAVTAADKVRPALERLCADGEFALERTRGVLTGAGYPANDVYVQPFTVSAAGTQTTPPPGAVYALHLGDRACVMGHVQPGQVLISVDGTNGEGSCIEAASH